MLEPTSGEPQELKHHFPIWELILVALFVVVLIIVLVTRRSGDGVAPIDTGAGSDSQSQRSSLRLPTDGSTPPAPATSAAPSTRSTLRAPTSGTTAPAPATTGGAETSQRSSLRTGIAP